MHTPKNTPRLATFAAGLFLMVLALDAHAAIRWVKTSTTNRTAGTGTETDPYTSLQYAYAQCNAGDVIYLTSGIHYPQGSEVLTLAKGTASAPVTIQSAPGGWAILDYAPRTTQVAAGIFINPAAQHVRLKSFSIRNVNNWGVFINASNVALTSLNIQNTYRSAIHAGDFDNGTVFLSNIELLYNEVTLAETRNSSRNFTPWNAGIDLIRVNNALVKGNVVKQVYGEGILLQRCATGRVEGNSVTDAFNCNYYIDNCNNTVITNNTSTSTLDSRFYRDGYPANGIGLSDENGGAPANTTNNSISYNRVSAANKSLWFWKGPRNDPNTGLKNCDFYQNTVNNAFFALIYIETGAHTSTSEVRDNNFVYDNATNSNPFYVVPAPIQRVNNRFYTSLSQIP